LVRRDGQNDKDHLNSIQGANMEKPNTNDNGSHLQDDDKKKTLGL
jgi:hypothetical protein